MKVLIIRFSSIGDIVLTSPIVRCVAQQLKAEIHFLTKKEFLPLVDHNPSIKKCFGFTGDFTITNKLAQEDYDIIIDLHNNLRSKRIRIQLKTKTFVYDKQTLNRFLLVNLKWDRLNGLHVVDRYFSAVENIGVENDGKGLEFFIPNETLTLDLPQQYIVAVIGTAHFTKDIPITLMHNILEGLNIPVILVGGEEHTDHALELVNKSTSNLFNFVGKTSLLETADIIQKSALVITPDTGMMHLAAALNKRIIAIYGSTSSLLGFTPYMPGNEDHYQIIEHESLNCRPCTKQGKQKCPKGHFKCMNDLDSVRIVEKAMTLIEN